MFQKGPDVPPRTPIRRSAYSNINLIDHVITKLLEKRGIYDKPLEKWKQGDPPTRKRWAVFHQFMVVHFMKLLAKHGNVQQWAMDDTVQYSMRPRHKTMFHSQKVLYSMLHEPRPSN